MVYMKDDGTVQYNHLEPHKLLSYMRLVCKGFSTPDKSRCALFNKQTKDGMDMSKYSDLLGKAIQSIIQVKDESEVDSLFSDGSSTFGQGEIKGLDDFELICFVVLKSNVKNKCFQSRRSFPINLLPKKNFINTANFRPL